MSHLTARRSKLKSSDAESHGRVRPIGRSALMQRDLPGDPRPFLPGTAGEKSADDVRKLCKAEVIGRMWWDAGPWYWPVGLDLDLTKMSLHRS